MDKDFLFWNQFKGTHRSIYQVFLVLFILSMAAYSIAYFIGPASVIAWISTPLIDSVKFTIDTINGSLYEFPFQLDSFIFYERMEGAPIEINKLAGYLYFSAFLFFSAMILAIFTYVQGYYFYGGLSVTAFFWAAMKLDLLAFAGRENNFFFIGTALVYLLITYGVKNWIGDRNLAARFTIFLSLNLLFAVALASFSEVADPVFFFANLSIFPLFILTIVFIVIVAFDVIYFFLLLVTYSGNKASKGRLVQFIVISSIYILNLWLVYLDNSNTYKLGAVAVSPFLLLVLSALLGIWAVRRRSGLFGNVLRFAPYGGMLYLCLGALSFITITYLFYTANDPLIEVVEDGIVYSQIGIGAMFVFYVIINFRGIIRQNLQAYKVVYEPRTFPFIGVRFAGIVIIGIFVFRANYFPYYQSIAGLWNARGDICLSEGEYYLAEQYFKEGFVFENRNHKSNYSLASLALKLEKPESELYFYKRAVEKQPTEYAYANLSNTYLKVDAYFDALFTIREGLEKFPGSAALMNNLGLLYETAKILDSAFLYYSMANNMQKQPGAARTNQLAFILKNDFVRQSGKQELYGKSIGSLYNNEIVYAGLAGSPIALLKEKSDSILDLLSFSILYNKTLAHIHELNQTDLSQLLALSLITDNNRYADDLKMLYGIGQIYNDDFFEGFNTLNNLVATGPLTQYVYETAAGMMALKYRMPELAIRYFESVNQSGGTAETYFYELIAKAESGEIIDTAEWARLVHSKSEGVARMSKKILDVAGSNDVETMDQSAKLIFLSYHFHKKNQNTMDRVYRSMNRDAFRASAWVAYLRFLMRTNELNATMNLLENPGFDTERYPEMKQEAELLKMELTLPNVSALKERLGNVEFSGELQPLLDYYYALTIEKENADSALRLYEKALRIAPWYTPGVEMAINFFLGAGERDKAYEWAYRMINLNERNPEYFKFYVIVSTEMAMFTYADIGLKQLEYLLDKAEYTEFHNLYQAKKSMVEKKISVW